MLNMSQFVIKYCEIHIFHFSVFVYRKYMIEICCYKVYLEG
jgi:hypothetical protein